MYYTVRIPYITSKIELKCIPNGTVSQIIKIITYNDDVRWQDFTKQKCSDLEEQLLASKFITTSKQPQITLERNLIEKPQTRYEVEPKDYLKSSIKCCHHL